MRFTIEKKLLISILGSIILTIMIVGAILIPTIMNIRRINTETYRLRLSLEAKNRRAANLRSSLQELERIRQEAARMQQHLFYSGQELQLITALENSAGDQGVEQKIISSNIDEPSKQIITLSLALSGKFPALLRYLAKIENMPYFITIRRIQLSAAPAMLSPNKEAQATVDLSLYVAH